MGYIVFWAALRSGFADTQAYIMAYSASPVGLTAALEEFDKGGKAPGWTLCQILFKTYITGDFHWWLAIIAILSGLPIMLTFRKKSADYLFSMFLFVASTTFSWMFNGIRQFLVAAILFGFYFLLIEKRRILFIGLVLVCSLIHTSAIIMLPAVFLIDCKPFGKTMTLNIVGILSLSFLVGPLLDAMDVMLQNSAYHGNLNQFAEDDGAHPLRVLLESMPVFLAFFKRKQIAALNNSFINLCINMSTISSGLFFIAMLTSGIMMGRLPIYFSLYNFILLPFLIYHVYASQRKLLYLGFYGVYLAFYLLLTPGYYYISDILGNYF
jgi:transmembrane protein epsG